MFESGLPSKPRDLRLDFFRGLALLLIFVAHVPGNWLARFRPGVFGFSDSADIFVFVSGYTAAVVYSRIFRHAGFMAGSARIFKRCAELYACHLGLFFSVAVILVMGNQLLQTEIDYVNLLNLEFFFEHPQEALLGLFAMFYVPNYFDILPMYMVALAMLPPLLLLARLHAALAGSASIALYLAVQFFKLEFPAEIAFYRPWFFNPLAWQFLFYTGFFLGAGWLKPAPARAWITLSCALYVILSIPLSHFPTYSAVPWLDNARRVLQPLVSKTDLGILRWLHLLALAFLMAALFRGRGRILEAKTASPFVKTGQQALPVFLTGMVLAHLAGMALDVSGRTIVTSLLVNAAGMFILIITAYIVEWFKSQPWRKSRPEAARSMRRHSGTPVEAPEAKEKEGMECEFRSPAQSSF